MISIRLSRWILLLVLCSYLVALHACKKDDTEKLGTGDGQETPGKIPGLGEMPGEPEGTQFNLPAGVRLIGEIEGQEDGSSSRDCLFDGQGFNVMVKMKLKRDSSVSGPLTVEFPPGLVITSTAEGFQHGLLVERMVVTIPPIQPGSGGNECQVSLLLFCLNSAKRTSDATARYKFGPVTSSKLLKDLINRLKGKKINYREFADGDPVWFENQEKIQDAIWQLTDGNGLREKDIQYLNELPNR
ncbi:hypothetical protein L0U88_11630 [Flavihumibacter sp. RY-1]|uniref:Lipoprotein n=1 Tax=Flavihumibacter fluminis TaxID=2909236 RepID=A0ABS9BJG8_9BACT|nr:hypothetical protein [Flavihumibacter fluminis]MCF1715278.1 hypothetical protein [Flavihumibacter fluminis]